MEEEGEFNQTPALKERGRNWRSEEEKATTEGSDQESLSKIAFRSKWKKRCYAAMQSHLVFENQPTGDTN